MILPLDDADRSGNGLLHLTGGIAAIADVPVCHEQGPRVQCGYCGGENVFSPCALQVGTREGGGGMSPLIRKFRTR